MGWLMGWLEVVDGSFRLIILCGEDPPNPPNFPLFHQIYWLSSAPLSPPPVLSHSLTKVVPRFSQSEESRCIRRCNWRAITGSASALTDVFVS